MQAPSRSPRWLPVSIGPVTRWMAGRLALAAAMSWAGTVLSQPPISTTASSGCARIISSVSIAMRLRKSMVVGFMKGSPSAMVGKASGSPPAASTPRFTASTSCGTVPWQLTRSPATEAMPITGRSSSDSV